MLKVELNGRGGHISVDVSNKSYDDDDDDDSGDGDADDAFILA